MIDMLKTGSDWLADKQKEFASQSVIYRRGANSVTIQAMPPQQSVDVADEQGGIVTSRSREFIFLAADLILNGLVEKPKRADLLEWNGNVYEALPVNDDVIWEWADSYYNQIIVHTQEVKAS